MTRSGWTPSMMSGFPALPERGDPAVADAHVGLDHAPVVEHHRPGDHQVGCALGAGRHRLAHGLADDLPAAEHHLLASARRATGQVLGDLDEQVGVGQRGSGHPPSARYRSAYLARLRARACSGHPLRPAAGSALRCPPRRCPPRRCPPRRCPPRPLSAPPSGLLGDVRPRRCPPRRGPASSGLAGSGRRPDDPRPANGTSVTSRVTPGSNRTAVPAGTSSRRPQAAARSKSSAGLAAAKW